MNLFYMHSVHEPLDLHDAPSTSQIRTIDQIFLNIVPIYGVMEEQKLRFQEKEIGARILIIRFIANCHFSRAT